MQYSDQTIYIIIIGELCTGLRAHVHTQTNRLGTRVGRGRFRQPTQHVREFGCARVDATHTLSQAKMDTWIDAVCLLPSTSRY